MSGPHVPTERPGREDDCEIGPGEYDTGKLNMTPGDKPLFREYHKAVGAFKEELAVKDRVVEAARELIKAQEELENSPGVDKGMKIIGAIGGAQIDMEEALAELEALEKGEAEPPNMWDGVTDEDVRSALTENAHRDLAKAAREERRLRQHTGINTCQEELERRREHCKAQETLSQILDELEEIQERWGKE